MGNPSHTYSSVQPSRPNHLPGIGVEAAAAVLVLGYSVVADRILPEVAYVPVNLAAAAAAVLLARRAGVTMAEMGLARERLVGGLRTGLATVAPIAVLVAAGVAIPWSRRFFLDADVVNASTGRALYDMLVRIPLGTALAEEVLFRGALLGLFLRRHRTGTAVALTSALFGLWHVSPTLSSFTSNPAAGSAVASGLAAKALAVAGIAVVTALAGAFFAWLRLRSGSVAAPWIAHTSFNSLAFLGGRIASRIQ
ncbi:MAG: CPBP family intramembrane metalloprotease [Actinobacteria bacterium]|nr:MAG: CPBP family intramembrane metalloprotease [Actinomycetota bacterium]